MQKPWQLQLLWGVGVGAGAGAVGLVMGATVVTRWFHRHCGLLIGILTASSDGSTAIPTVAGETR